MLSSKWKGCQTTNRPLLEFSFDIVCLHVLWLCMWFLWVIVRVCDYECVYVLYLCMYVSVCVGGCVSLCVSVCMWVCVFCICVCAHTCMHAYVHSIFSLLGLCSPERSQVFKLFPMLTSQEKSTVQYFVSLRKLRKEIKTFFERKKRSSWVR